jgi:hypothetical protein
LQFSPGLNANAIMVVNVSAGFEDWCAMTDLHRHEQKGPNVLKCE